MIVVLPFFEKDRWVLIKNLQWMKELDEHIDATVVLATDFLTQTDEVKALAETLFSRVEVFQYRRLRYNGAEINEWPFQQNNAFACTAKWMSCFSQPWLWMETDVTPIRSGWYSDLVTEYSAGGKPVGGVVDTKSGYINGVAIYPPKLSEICDYTMIPCGIMTGKRFAFPFDMAITESIRPHFHPMPNHFQFVWGFDITQADTVVNRCGAIFHGARNGELIDYLRLRKAEHKREQADRLLLLPWLQQIKDNPDAFIPPIPQGLTTAWGESFAFNFAQKMSYERSLRPRQ